MDINQVTKFPGDLHEDLPLVTMGPLPTLKLLGYRIFVASESEDRYGVLFAASDADLRFLPCTLFTNAVLKDLLH